MKIMKKNIQYNQTKIVIYSLCFQFIQKLILFSLFSMSNSDIYATNIPRIKSLHREESGNLKKNLYNQMINLTKSSHPAHLYNLSQANDPFFSGEVRRQSDARSLIEQLMGPQKKFKNTLNSFPENSPASRPVLVNTEQRIFQQVITLLLEINEIKESIQKEKELTAKMQAERQNILGKAGNKGKTKKQNDLQMESIINKLKLRQGEDLQISAAQLQKITAENEHLEKNINRLKIKSKGNLKQVLEEEKQKYRSLKKKLEEKNNESGPCHSKTTFNGGASSEMLEQIKRLQNDIERLESGLQDGTSIGYQIKKLSQQNERLKEKTLQLIKNQARPSEESPHELEERRRLQAYIKQEQENKLLFFEDLKRFKEEYNNLKLENEQLKARLKGSHSGSRMQSFGSQGRYHYSDSKHSKDQQIVAEMNRIIR